MPLTSKKKTGQQIKKGTLAAHLAELNKANPTLKISRQTGVTYDPSVRAPRPKKANGKPKAPKQEQAESAEDWKGKLSEALDLISRNFDTLEDAQAFVDGFDSDSLLEGGFSATGTLEFWPKREN